MFCEEKYYASFKILRNRFRKYRYYELLSGCFEYLHAPYTSTVDFIKRAPWLVLLFAKWLLLDDNYPNRGGKVPTKNDLMMLLQSAHDLTVTLRMPDEYEHYTLYLRNVAYQQFPYQIDFDRHQLARQSIIFSDLPAGHLIKTQYKDLTGVSIQDFLELSWMLSGQSTTGNQASIPAGWFEGLREGYDPKTVDQYVGSISKDIQEVRELLLRSDDGRRRSTEHYEFTPFINYPLLKGNDGYLITENRILYRCLEHFIYDRLRQWDAAKFMEKFGGIFERYAERALAYAGVNYSTENQISASLGVHGNQIDFIVHEDGANVFIDTKGVEMSYQGRVGHSSKILKDKTKQSVLKAIKQAHDVIRKLESRADCGIHSQQNNYLLVVTFKELYLGSGRNYYEVVAKEAMDEIYRQYSGTAVIPPENMYFITIDSLDSACAMIKKGGLTFSRMIDVAKAKDRDPESRRFDFVQHLHDMPVAFETPQYLRDRNEHMAESLIERFSR